MPLPFFCLFENLIKFCYNIYIKKKEGMNMKKKSKISLMNVLTTWYGIDSVVIGGL